MQLAWALHNIRLDREERVSEQEDLVIFSGLFTNPSMARHLAETKKARSKEALEEIEEAVRKVDSERRLAGAPVPDSDIQAKIVGRKGEEQPTRSFMGDDDIRSLGDIAKGYEDAGS